MLHECHESEYSKFLKSLGIDKEKMLADMESRLPEDKRNRLRKMRLERIEGLEKAYYADRPTEPYSDDDSPNDWANIAHYAEENLEKAFKRIEELEEQIEKMKCCGNCENRYGQEKCANFLDKVSEILGLMKDLFFDCWQEKGLRAIKFEQKVNDFLKGRNCLV